MTADEALVALDGLGQAELVRRGDLAPWALVEAARGRYERLDPALNAVVHADFERALARARALTGREPLAGVPLLVKESAGYDGLPTASSTRAWAGRSGIATPPFVHALERAGAVVVGKSNMPEGGFLPSTESLLYGATRNPWNTDRSAGGSSGGAGAAMAAGLVPLAHGSDGGGSIRIPAAFCGVFGLKPTRGRTLAARSSHPIEDFLVSDMVLTRSVRDAAACLAVVEAQGPWPPVGPIRSPSTNRLRIGWTTRNLVGDDAEPVVAAAVTDAASLCAELGHQVVQIPPPFDDGRLLDAFQKVWMSLADEFVRALGDGPSAEPWTLGLADDFRRRDPAIVAESLAVMDAASQTYAGLFETLDVVLTPVTRMTAPRLGVLAPDMPYDGLFDSVFDMVSYTPLHNAVGAPAMSIPYARDPQRVPIGVMFAAAPGRERTLLELAFEIEAARPWPRTAQPSSPPPRSIEVL